MRVPDRDAVGHREVYLDQNHRTGPPLGTQQSRWTTSVANSAAGTRAARPGRTPSGRGWGELDCNPWAAQGATNTLLIRVVPPERGSP
jgi:hypothetical protein